jgi:O-acetyl-ADP-ribose deacetylase (regulator of RNase III)
MGQITILVADILQSKAQTLINTVNCVGVMGKGIALEFFAGGRGSRGTKTKEI